MSDISTLESRITAALERIRKGLDKPAPPSDSGGLEAALEARVSQLKDRQDTQVAKLTGRIETYQTQILKLDEELQQLRASNVQLRGMNAKLRETVTTGLAPELHDAALAAEVEAIAAQRSADAAEVDAILAELKPLIEETSNATN